MKLSADLVKIREYVRMAFGVCDHESIGNDKTEAKVYATFDELARARVVVKAAKAHIKAESCACGDCLTCSGIRNAVAAYEAGEK